MLDVASSSPSVASNNRTRPLDVPADPAALAITAMADERQSNSHGRAQDRVFANFNAISVESGAQAETKGVQLNKRIIPLRDDEFEAANSPSQRSNKRECTRSLFYFAPLTQYDLLSCI